MMIAALSRAAERSGGCVTWRQVLAVAGGVDQDVGVEGGVEPFVSTVEGHRLTVSDEYIIVSSRLQLIAHNHLQLSLYLNLL